MSVASSSKPATPPRRRRWLQFSVRSLLVLMLFCCVGFELWNVYVEPYRRQARLAAQITDLGGMVDTQGVNTWWGSLLGRKYACHLLEVGFLQPPTHHNWLVRLADAPHLRTLYLENVPIGDAGLAPLDNLHELELLGLAECGVTDAGLMHLQKLTRLKNLQLKGCRITDAGIAALEHLTELDRLDLTGTQVTDAGIARLASKQKLTEILLDDTDVTEASLAHLRMLPGLYQVKASGTQIVPSALRAALPATDLGFEVKVLNEVRTQKQFVQTPLATIMNWFGTGIADLAIDRQRLQRVGLDLSTPLTLTLDDKSFVGALQKAFQPLGVKCVVRYGVLLLTTEDDPQAYPPRLTLKRGEGLSREFSRQLYEPADLTFSQTPLTDLLQFLAKERGIPILLHESVPPATGESPTTCNYVHTAMANALELIFMDLDLHGEIENNTIYVYPGPVGH